jgi:hypothetical protein
MLKPSASKAPDADDRQLEVEVASKSPVDETKLKPGSKQHTTATPKMQLEVEVASSPIDKTKLKPGSSKSTEARKQTTHYRDAQN